MVELRQVDAGYGRQVVVQNASFGFVPGRVTVLLGPNGCGKTTLLKTALGLLPALGGQVLYGGVPVARLSPAQVARQAAYMAQSHTAPNILARRMVLHGRFAYLGFPRRYRREDFAAVAEALAQAGAAAFANTPMPALSGGQRQRVYLARALAQQTDTILMDEPTTWLDARHQLEVMAAARRLAAQGRAVGMVCHDLCLALRTADTVVLLAGGRVQMTGTPDEVFASGALDEAFGVRLRRFAAENGWQYYYA